MELVHINNEMSVVEGDRFICRKCFRVRGFHQPMQETLRKTVVLGGFRKSEGRHLNESVQRVYYRCPYCETTSYC